jgi:hypothetical protein
MRMILGDAPGGTFRIFAIVEEAKAGGAASRHLREHATGLVMQRLQHVIDIGL